MKPTNFHPAVTALETAMANYTAAQQQVAQYSRWAGESVTRVDPTTWTKQIEEAMGKPDEMERLRVLYDEEALQSMSSWLRANMLRRKYFAAGQSINEGIRGILAVLKTIDKQSPDQWMIPIMQTRCVEAAELQKDRTDDIRVDDRNSTYTRVYNILVATFSALAERHANGYVQETVELVTPGRKYQSHLCNSVDLRNVYMVEFIDCQNSKHPGSQMLWDLYSTMQPLLDAARLAMARVRGGQNPYSEDCSKINNGTINERQHAGRLVDALHGVTSGCGYQSLDKQVAEQNERRRQYESVRQEVLIAMTQLKALYGELIKAYVESLGEIKQLLSEVQGDRCATIDRIETVTIGMNNCLAIDLLHRAITRELRELAGVYRKDYSQGAGLQATVDKFAEVERIYRPFEMPKSPGEGSET